MKRNIEVECKLIAPDACALKALPAALSALCSSVRAEGQVVLDDTYMDTPDWRFFKAGYAFRVRHMPDRAILTLKALVHPQGGVSVREELEEELPLPLPRSLNPIPGRRVGRKAREIASGQLVRQLFRNRNRRTIYLVSWGKAFQAEVAADDFTLIAQGQRERLAEVEIEVCRGGLADLRRFARQLAKMLHLRIEHRGKFRQGLRVACLRPPRAQLTTSPGRGKR